MEAIQVLSRRAFQTAVEAATANPACVPARAALFKLYLAVAAPPEAECGTALSRVLVLLASAHDVEEARAAVQVMADALAAMDPIHSGWYAAAAARVAPPA